MKKIYCICGQLVANEIYKNEHILSHFKQKHCIGCDKQLIFVAGKWYQPHVDNNCVGFKQEPEYDNSETNESCDPCTLGPDEPAPSIGKSINEVLIGMDPLEHLIPESIVFEDEFLDQSDESMPFNEEPSESTDETPCLPKPLPKSYPCKVCPISFMRKHNLKAHMKKYHPTYTEDSKGRKRVHEVKRRPVKRDRPKESNNSSHGESFEETNELLEEIKAEDENNRFETNQADSIESSSSAQLSKTSNLKPNRGPKVRLFGCPLCSIRFTRRSNAARHIKQYHHDNENAQNGTCAPIESSSNQERDSRVRNFKCSLCTLRFVYRRNLNRHIRETHHDKNKGENHESNTAESSNQCGESKSKQFGCSLCSIRFTHISSAKRHLRQFHGGDGAVVTLNISDSQNEESKPTELPSNPVAPPKDHQSQSSYEKKPFGCPLCTFRFTRRGNVNRHIRQCHQEGSKDLLNYQDPGESSSNQEKDSKEKQFGCPLCSSRFIQRSSAVRHMRDIHGEEDYSLNDSPTLASFDHFKENPYGCAICESRFKHRQDLIEHKRVVHQIMSSAYKKKRLKIDRKFICDLCGKIFQVRHTFKLHMDMHMDRRPFSCELCGKTFRRSMSLSEHRHTHTGTKPFTCNVEDCDGAFVRRTELFRHQFKKHGILRKTIQCSLCDQVFPENSLLRKHLKNHA